MLTKIIFTCRMEFRSILNYWFLQQDRVYRKYVIILKPNYT
jgi:hypothetical protein